MTRTATPQPPMTREARIEAILQDLRPAIDARLRRLVEQAVDVPEAEEFGPIDLVFRDAGQQLVSEVRQAAVASRKKRGTSAAASTARTATGSPNSTPTKAAGC